ncbi:MAG: helix-turn-helix domain-containing protein [Faecalibacterium sp.]
MPFQYKKNIMEELKKAGYSSTRLRREKLLGESYMSQLRHGEMISWAALDVVCTILNCQPGDLIEHTCPEGVYKTDKPS